MDFRAFLILELMDIALPEGYFPLSWGVGEVGYWGIGGGCILPRVGVFSLEGGCILPRVLGYRGWGGVLGYRV